MKTFFNKLLVGLGLSAVLALNSQAQYIVSTNLTTTSTNLLLLGPAKVASLQMLAGAAALTVSVYDNAGPSNTLYVPGYTGFTNYVTNVTFSYISPLTGTTNLQTNSQVVGVPFTVAANSNILNGYTFYVPANQSLTVPFPSTLLISRGIVVVNNTNGSVAFSYRVAD